MDTSATFTNGLVTSSLEVNQAPYRTVPDSTAPGGNMVRAQSPFIIQRNPDAQAIDLTDRQVDYPYKFNPLSDGVPFIFTGRNSDGWQEVTGIRPITTIDLNTPKIVMSVWDTPDGPRTGATTREIRASDSVVPQVMPTAQAPQVWTRTWGALEGVAGFTGNTGAPVGPAHPQQGLHDHGSQHRRVQLNP